MKTGKKVLSCAVGALLLGSLLLGGCNNPMFDFGGYEYPDFPLADQDDTIDSWTQWEEDEIINIDWFIDSTSYSLPREGSQVMDEILRKTGVKINFRKATTGDGSELTTMIAGNDLPDLVSVTAGMDNLVNGAKVFPINGLAERWAPSLWRRIMEEGEMYNTYKDADDELFYIVNNFYNSEEMEDYRETGRGYSSQRRNCRKKGLSRRFLYVQKISESRLDGRADGKSRGDIRVSYMDEKRVFVIQRKPFRIDFRVRFQRRVRKPRDSGTDGIFLLCGRRFGRELCISSVERKFRGNDAMAERTLPCEPAYGRLSRRHADANQSVYSDG